MAEQGEPRGRFGAHPKAHRPRRVPGRADFQYNNNFKEAVGGINSSNNNIESIGKKMNIGTKRLSLINCCTTSMKTTIQARADFS
jgi:hypothetical protein